MGLTKLAIARPVFILMLMMLAILMGTRAFFSMRLEQNPEVTFGVITITTLYPGAGSDEINTLVSRPIEDAISGINGLLEVTSTSQEGVSGVIAQFEIGTNMDEALNDLRSKIDTVIPQLPIGIEKPVISKIDTSSTPVLTLTVKSPTLSGRDLRDLIDDKIKDRFARIPGVANAVVTGGDIREIQVQVSKDRLLSYGIGISDVQRAIQSGSLNAPSGRIISGEKELNVRVIGEFQSVDEMRDLVIPISDPQNPMAKAQPVRLSNIADVVDTTAERRAYSRINGSDAVTINIQKAREGNAVQISAAATALIGELKETHGLEIIKAFDESIIITESLSDLTFALFFGIALVTLIVFLFLHDIRGTLIVAIAIPICLLATFVALWALGFTINNMSMLALSLAIGVLVDDAIVVLENIYRHLKKGEPPLEAAINGRAEIGLAAIAITLADVVVFIPVGFMGGVVGQFFKPLGIGFAVAVVLSLFVSFTVTPMLAARWYRKGEDVEHPKGSFPVWFENRFNNLSAAYGRGLEWALNHRWFVFNAGFTALIAVFMFIGGSSIVSGPFQAATVGLPLTIFCLCIGLSIFGFKYWKRGGSTRSYWRLVLGSALVLFIATKVLGGASAPGPVQLLILGFVVAGLLGFLGNLLRPRLRSRLILSALAFGLVFPIAGMSGYVYRQWKQEDVFKFQFMPESDQGKVVANIELPPGANLETTTEVAKRLETIVLRHPDTKYVVTQIGSRGLGFNASDQGANLAQLDITLKDKKALMDSLKFWAKTNEGLRTKNDTQVAAELIQQIGKVPGAMITVSASAGNQGFGSPIQMSFTGLDREATLKTAMAVRDRLLSGAIEGVVNPDISSKAGKPELRAIPDRARLGDAGITTAEIAGSMRTMYEGNKDAKFRVQGKEYDIRVIMNESDRNNPQIINQLPVKFVQGRPIFLPEVARIEQGVGLDKIDRRNRAEEIRVTADLLPGFAAGSVQQKIDEWIKKQNLVPAEVSKKNLGQANVQNREQGYLFTALLTGLVLVYMLLASLYDNLVYPFIIQLAQPQAMVGALMALIITNKALTIVGFIGLIALVGLVGKNAILLVDYTNTLRSRGKERHDALVEAGPTRLRPILMTTLAVVLGMLPVALAIGRGSEFRETIGIVIIGGITLSTMLTLFIIPCSYTIFDDLSIALGKFLRRREVAWKEEPGEETSPQEVIKI